MTWAEWALFFAVLAGAVFFIAFVAGWLTGYL